MEWRAVKTKQYTYVKYIDGREKLFDNINDPFQLENLVKSGSGKHNTVKNKMRDFLKQQLSETDDSLYPGTYYSDWYNEDKTHLLRTAQKDSVKI